MSSESEVIQAAQVRAAALAARDPDALSMLLHPSFAWITHTGELLSRDTYIERNTEGALRWSQQELDDIDVVVVGSTAVLRCIVADMVDAGNGMERFVMPMTQVWIGEGTSWQCLAGHAGPRQL